MPRIYLCGIEIDKCGNKNTETDHRMTVAHKAIYSLNLIWWNKSSIILSMKLGLLIIILQYN
jgi:hypothetical protein